MLFQKALRQAQSDISNTNYNYLSIVRLSLSKPLLVKEISQ